MPRVRRPGPRQNRTDLPSPGAGAAQPVRAMTGQDYGDRQRAQSAQRTVPLPDRSTAALAAATPTTDPTSAPQGGGGPGGAAPPADLLSQFLAAAQSAQSPGNGLLAEPDDPNRPLTAGLDVGSGPGSEVLSTPAAAGGPDPSVILWASALPALDVIASLPGSSPQVRQFYRRIRSQLPPDYYDRTEQ